MGHIQCRCGRKGPSALSRGTTTQRAAPTLEKSHFGAWARLGRPLEVLSRRVPALVFDSHAQVVPARRFASPVTLAPAKAMRPSGGNLTVALTCPTTRLHQRLSRT